MPYRLVIDMPKKRYLFLFIFVVCFVTSILFVILVSVNQNAGVYYADSYFDDESLGLLQGDVYHSASPGDYSVLQTKDTIGEIKQTIESASIINGFISTRISNDLFLLVDHYSDDGILLNHYVITDLSNLSYDSQELNKKYLFNACRVTINNSTPSERDIIFPFYLIPHAELKKYISNNDEILLPLDTSISLTNSFEKILEFYASTNRFKIKYSNNSISLTGYSNEHFTDLQIAEYPTIVPIQIKFDGNDSITISEIKDYLE
ncbi:hypothetical protein [Intestinibacillus massiliensis]